MALYGVLDIEVTLRCDASCPNCIKLCNTDRWSGLDYSDSDMSLGQIETFVRQVEALAAKTGQRVVDHLCLTGGEPTVHPRLQDIVDIIDRRLKRPGFIGQLTINSNLLNKADEKLVPLIVNWSTIPQKPDVHDAAFVHPDDMRVARPTYAACTHYRKPRLVLSTYGYSVCCAGDGYMRLFGLAALFINELPETLAGFPLAKMDDVCQHCAFGTGITLKERVVGRPISPIYKEQAELNKAGRRVLNRLPETAIESAPRTHFRIGGPQR